MQIRTAVPADLQEIVNIEVNNNSCETACRNAGGFFCTKGSTAAKVFFLCSIAFFQHPLYLSDFSYFG